VLKLQQFSVHLTRFLASAGLPSGTIWTFLAFLNVFLDFDFSLVFGVLYLVAIFRQLSAR